MTKIMLVEDDKSLREIYGVRLLAEGYDIVSAGDGEEALAMAIKERPQLIISDVMMPKVSGYDMLDILRSTTETKNIRVIMMTALSSEEQRTRAESLGADRYLVKSQVGIEDVVRVVHEVLEDTPAIAGSASPLPVASTPATSSPVQPATPAQPTPVAVTQAQPVAPQLAPPPAPPVPVVAPVAPTNSLPVPGTVPGATAAPATPRPPISDAPKPTSIKTRIIQPLHDPNISPVNINDLLDKELAKEAGIADEMRPAVESMSQEKALVAEQIKAFNPAPIEPTPVTPPPVTEPIPSPAVPPVSSLPTPGVATASNNNLKEAKNVDASPTIPAFASPTVVRTPTDSDLTAPSSPLPSPTAPVPVGTSLETPSVTSASGPAPVVAPLPDVPKV